MKGNYFFIAGLAFALITAGCSSPRKTSGSGNAESAIADSTATQPKKMSAERERVANKEKWLGSEIVEESVNRLDSKLSTSKATNERIKVVLTDTFKAIGGDLNMSYTNKEAREMGKKIIIKAQIPIVESLENDSQRTAFKELLLN